MLTGNKGEWSEVYTLLKILSDKQLFAGNSNLQRLTNVVYPIIQIIRNEAHNNLNFSYQKSQVHVQALGGQSYLIPISDFTVNASHLLSCIKSAKSGTFNVPSIESFLNSFGSNSIKAKSSVKSDITIKIYDSRTGLEPTLGFSIKSQLGGKSTILNASHGTNIVYKIRGGILSQNDISYINDIDSSSKIMDRLKEISKLGGKLEYIDTVSPIFRNNLLMVDSSLPRILGEALTYYYNGVTNSISDIATLLEANNPLGYDQSTGHSYYSYKIKKMLWDIALGMMPQTVWTGQYDATGGYLVVKKSGDIVCYHVYNKTEFEEYLFLNTQFETASSTRNKFGSIYSQKDELFFNLNTQIRFK
jgi:type II restriction enzyme